MLSSLQKKLAKAARRELANRSLDIADFPEALQPEIEQILQDKNSETDIYRLFNLVVPYFLDPSQLKVNSFSLGFMDQLYSSLDKLDIVGNVNASSLAKLSTLNPSSAHNLEVAESATLHADLHANLDVDLDADSQLALVFPTHDQFLKIGKDTTDPVINKFNEHQGPKPVLEARVISIGNTDCPALQEIERKDKTAKNGKANLAEGAVKQVETSAAAKKNAKESVEVSATAKESAEKPLESSTQVSGSNPLEALEISKVSSQLLLHERLMPDEVTRLVCRIAKDGSSDLSLWMLRKLGDCPFVIPPERVGIFNSFFWGACRYCATLEDFNYVSSSFAIRKLIYKFGGTRLKYVLPHGKYAYRFASVFIEHPPLNDEEIDYDWLFAHGAPHEVGEFFEYARHFDGEFSRQLFYKYFPLVDDKKRAEMVAAFVIGSTPKDAPIYVDLLNHEYEWHRRHNTLRLLRRLPNTEYAAQCAKQFKAHVKFENNGWTIEPFVYNDELKALYVDPPDPKLVERSISAKTAASRKASAKAASREMLQFLIWSMDINSILSLMGKGNRVEALQAFIDSNTSGRPRVLFDPDKFDFNELLLAKIRQSKDQELADYVFEHELLDCFDYREGYYLLAMTSQENRVRFFKKLSSNFTWSISRLFVPEWFVRLSLGERPLDFVPMERDWAEAVTEHVLSKVYYLALGDLHVLKSCCILYLPYEMIDWLDKRRAEYKELVTEMGRLIRHKQGVEDLGYSPSLKRKHYKASIEFIDMILPVLRLKARTEEAIKKHLPEYYVEDLRTQHFKHNPVV